MAASTGIVLTAGAFALGDMILTDGYSPEVALKLTVATVAAAFVSAGLDKVAAGLGTGLAVLLLLTAILGNGPKIADNLFPATGTAGIRPA